MCTKAGRGRETNKLRAAKSICLLIYHKVHSLKRNMIHTTCVQGGFTTLADQLSIRTIYYSKSEFSNLDKTNSASS